MHLNGSVHVVDLVDSTLEGIVEDRTLSVVPEGAGPASSVPRSFRVIGTKSCLSSSLLKEAHPAASAGASELLSILQNQSQSPVKSFLGVSPPVRSGWQGGATNPLAHVSVEKVWAQALQANLQYLKELDPPSSSPLLRGFEQQTLLFAASPPVHSDGEPIRPCCRRSAAYKEPCKSSPSMYNPSPPFRCHAEYYTV